MFTILCWMLCVGVARGGANVYCAGCYVWVWLGVGQMFTVLDVMCGCG